MKKESWWNQPIKMKDIIITLGILSIALNFVLIYILYRASEHPEFLLKEVLRSIFG